MYFDVNLNEISDTLYGKIYTYKDILSVEMGGKCRSVPNFNRVRELLKM